jgi:hypothetical protein
VRSSSILYGLLKDAAQHFSYLSSLRRTFGNRYPKREQEGVCAVCIRLLCFFSLELDFAVLLLKKFPDSIRLKRMTST